MSGQEGVVRYPYDMSATVMRVALAEEGGSGGQNRIWSVSMPLQCRGVDSYWSGGREYARWGFDYGHDRSLHLVEDGWKLAYLTEGIRDGWLHCQLHGADVYGPLYRWRVEIEKRLLAVVSEDEVAKELDRLITTQDPWGGSTRVGSLAGRTQGRVGSGGETNDVESSGSHGLEGPRLDLQEVRWRGERSWSRLMRGTDWMSPPNAPRHGSAIPKAEANAGLELLRLRTLEKMRKSRAAANGRGGGSGGGGGDAGGGDD